MPLVWMAHGLVAGEDDAVFHEGVHRLADVGDEPHPKMVKDGPRLFDLGQAQDEVASIEDHRERVSPISRRPSVTP